LENKLAMSKVLVTDPLSELGLSILKETAEVNYSPGLKPAEIIKIIGDYDALLVRSGTQVTKEIIDACSSKMKIIGRAGVGVDNIEVEPATQKGIIVVNSPDGNTTAAAEQTVTLMMGLARMVGPADLSMKAGEWKRSKFLGVELHNKTLGVVGLGKIGTKVAQIAQAIGMRVQAYDPVVSLSRAESLNIKLVELEAIWKESDFITLHVPKIPQTANMINKDTIALMKPEARIINCARGGIINEHDLAEAIASGRIAGAALDVFENEPLEAESPLRRLGYKVLLTPHLGASTEEAQANVSVDVAEQICEVLKGGFARSAVNLPGLRGAAVEELKAHLELSALLGSFLTQFSGAARPQQLTVQVSGDLTKKEISPLVLAATQGFLSQKIEGVTFVNARLIAQERGIKVVESKSTDKTDYTEEVVLELKTDKGDFEVGGTLQNGKLPMITRLNQYSFLVAPTDHMLLTLHNDKPGVIAKISKTLGDNDINISGMALGRRSVRDEALMICSLDDPLSEDALAQIKAAQEVKKAAYISL
jgi:D-3-phosphoglycerate dehydrogenase / 2-oxoglutarate reductase